MCLCLRHTLRATTATAAQGRTRRTCWLGEGQGTWHGDSYKPATRSKEAVWPRRAPECGHVQKVFDIAAAGGSAQEQRRPSPTFLTSDAAGTFLMQLS